MRVLVLSAGTALSATRLHEVTETLQTAAGGGVDIDLFSWRAAETREGLRAITVLGPVKVYVPPAEPARPPTTTALSTAAQPAGRPVPRRVDEPEEASDEEPDDPPSADDDAGAPAEVLTPRRLVGRVYWGTRRGIIRFRRSKQYQSVRRLVRGGIARQFSTKARRNPAVLAAARNSQVVCALDSGAIAAAWWVAKKVPGPPVVFGVPAAERELRMLAEPGVVGTHH
jgi:hypothetical protein